MALIFGKNYMQCVNKSRAELNNNISEYDTEHNISKFKYFLFLCENDWDNETKYP